MKRILFCVVNVLLMVACQRELHFLDIPVNIPLPEKVVAAIVVTNPSETDYDSMVFRYSRDKTREVHYSGFGDSVTRTYYYDANGRLSALEDEKAIYYTNNNTARRISFQYDGGGQLLQTKTDFVNVSGITAEFINTGTPDGKQIIAYDTAYTGNGYNVDWVNRIIYSNINSSDYLLYDSALFINTTTTGLIKTTVNIFSYGADSSVMAIDKRIYFNGELSEQGTVTATRDQPAPVYQALRKKLYRNLSNWFETGSVWQDDNYHIFPLPGGPYKSIFYAGHSFSAGPDAPPFTRNYEYENTYSGDQLDKSVITYSLAGQGTNNYINLLRVYYRE